MIAGALCAAMVLLALAARPALGAQTMSGEDLRALVSGKHVYLAVPLGGEFPLYYRSNGTVEGSGEAVGLGRLLRPTDSGHWWVMGPRLCQKWQNWYDGKPFCFSISRTSASTIDWRCDDGFSGTARIADR
jgi:hypothetical protein